MTYRISQLLKRLLPVIILLLFPVFVFSQSKIVVKPSSTIPEFKGIRLVQGNAPPGRPKIGLVLSGGGARGIAQVGVLRILEKYHIPIDAIVGTSLGSVIGGLYASGYSTAQLESVVTNTDWDDLLSFSEETKRTDVFVGQKESRQNEFLEIRFDGLQPIIPSSISGGQRLSNYFSYLTLQAFYHPNPSFDDLKIPFRAVATDLISGKRVILDRGSLSEAMRASVAVPLLYAPLDKDSMLLVDGGLVSNIPVDVAKSLGCDFVIVVNSSSPMRSADQMSAPWEVADQIMTIMAQETNKMQLKMADAVITPDAGTRLVSDFEDIAGLVSAGEKAAEQSIEILLSTLQHKEQNDSNYSYSILNKPVVTIEGDSLPQSIKEDIHAMIQTDSLSLQSIQQGLNRLNETGMFTNIFAEVIDQTSLTTVTVYPALNNRIEEINYSGNIVVSDVLIEKEIAPLKGSVFEYKKIQKCFENILGIYRSKGFSLARIESVQVNNGNRTVSFLINEGTIKEITYEGNIRTKDYIIRREFPLEVGDVFNMDKAYQGIVNIKSTGLFEYVLLEASYKENHPVLILKVHEKSSELLRLGLQADYEHSLVTTVGIRDANFRGAWEDFGIVLKYGFRDRSAKAEYTVNRIFNTYFTSNMKFYYNSRDIITYADDPALSTAQWDRMEDGRFRENKYGWSLAFGSHFERFGDVSAELRVEGHKIIGLTGQGYTPESYRLVGIKLQTIIDTENKFSFPTKGIYFSFSYESAIKNLGSEVGFGKVGLKYESYLTLLPRHTLRPRVTFGFADETLPIAEQYSLGGFGSFFGLREDDSRGRQLFLVNMEYRFWLPFKIIFETYLKFRYDLGTISAIPKELKFNSFRHGVGATIALDTPLGETQFGAGKSFHFIQELPTSPVSVGPLLFYFSFGYHF